MASHKIPSNHTGSAKTDLSSPLISYWREKAMQPLALDMSANPYDLRPAAHAVVNRVESMRELNPDEPLIMPMGEHHDIPHTHMWQQAVMQETINRGLRPAYGMEFSHLSFQEDMKLLGFEMDADSAHRVTRQDPHNVVLRQLELAIRENQAQTQCLQFCEEKGISLSFNDVARTEVGDDDAFLDYDDALTKQIAKSCGYSASEKELNERAADELTEWDMHILDYGGHHVVSPTGFHIRNAMMVHNALLQWSAQKPDVVVMGTGLIHVFGSVHKDIIFKTPHDQSMTALLRQKTAAVIPCGYDHDEFDFPKDADQSAAIILHGFASAENAVDSNNTEAVDAAIQRVCDESQELMTYYPCLEMMDRQVYFNRLGDVMDIAFDAFKNDNVTTCPDTSSLWFKKSAACLPK